MSQSSLNHSQSSPSQNINFKFLNKKNHPNHLKKNQKNSSNPIQSHQNSTNPNPTK